MTREQTRYLRVGLLLVGGLLLGLGFVWFLGGPHIGQGEKVESYFSESVQGLEIGAPVKYRGVTLGRVTDIGLVSAEYGNQPEQFHIPTYRLVFVRYVIDRARIGRNLDIAAAIRLGLRARLAAQGLTGLSYLELDFVDPHNHPPVAVPWTPAVAYIPSIPSTLLQVQDAAMHVLAKLDGVDIERLTATLTGLLQDLRAQMSGGDVDQAMRQVSVLAQTLRDAVQAADLPGLTANLRQSSDAVRALAQGPELRHTLTGVDKAASALARVAARLPPLIAALQATTRQAGDSTADVQQALVPLLRDLQATARNLREATELLRRSPGQLLSAPPPRTRDRIR